MRISVVGSGYVGLVTGACFAESGNDVTCVDCDEHKIHRLRKSDIPIYEPGLAEIVRRNSTAGRLRFTVDLAEAVLRSRVIFLAVGTPPALDGSADLSAILGVARDIGRAMDGPRIVVMKSTVPVGTHNEVEEAVRAQTDHPVQYVSNPEFLKEGAAIDDFTKPDRVVIGSNDSETIAIMRQLYAPFMRRRECIYVMDPASAEMTKYAANAMLAARISFMNEIAGLCDRYGADVEKVRAGIGSDARIGSAFLYPGVGYGGSCFPKDVTALMAMGQAVDYPLRVVTSVHEVNQRQREAFAERIIEYFGPNAEGATLAVWGLAFKARTDDIREAPAIFCTQRFLDAGMRVQAHDPEAMMAAREALGDRVQMFESRDDALDGADALVVFTDWAEFRVPDFELIAQKLSRKVVFDGRNMYEPEVLARAGLLYVCIGRPNSSGLAAHPNSTPK